MDLGSGRRRRGAELEAALLDAAWEQLLATGYGGFTYEAVAERAHTSKPVLYRRWPNLNDLLLATFRHHGAATRPPMPDTGSLRTDTIAAMKRMEVRRAEILAVNSAVAGIFFGQTPLTLSDVRNAFIGEGRSGMEILIDRALARGELTERPSERVMSLPADLFRNEALLTLQPVPDEVLEQIVDEIFLPLVLPRESGSPAEN